MIPYSTQCIEEDDIQAVVEALKKEYLTIKALLNVSGVILTDIDIIKE